MKLLTQEEYDSFFDIDIKKEYFPIFLYLKKNSNNQFEILELNYDETRKLVNSEIIFEHMIKNAFESQGYNVLMIFSSKKDILSYLQNKLAELSEIENEIKFIKNYIKQHPEYIL